MTGPFKPLRLAAMAGALSLALAGGAAADAIPMSLETFIIHTRTDQTGRFDVEHGLCRDPSHSACYDIEAINIGAQSTVNGTWYTSFSWAEEMRWGWTNRTVSGVIGHKDFLNANVRIVIFARR